MRYGQLAAGLVATIVCTAPACTEVFDRSRLDAGDALDAGARDAGEDGGTRDASRDAEIDAGSHDAGIDDAGIDDAGIDDAGIDDAGIDDASTHDASTHDASTHDAGLPDGGPRGCPDVAPRTTTELGTATRPPLDALDFARPPVGEWLVDPTFGSCIARVTDAERSSGAGFDAPGEISRDGSTLLVTRDGYQYRLVDLVARGVGGDEPTSIFGNDAPRFHPTEPGVVRVLVHDSAELQVAERALALPGLTVLHDFRAPVTAVFPTAYELRPVSRGSYSDVSTALFAVRDVAGNWLGLVTLDLAAGTRRGHRALSGYDGAGITPGGRVVVSYGDRAVVYDDTFASERPVSFGRTALDWDLARLPGGQDALVWATPSRLEMLDLSDPQSVPREVLTWARPPTRHPPMRISGAAWDRPGWVVLAFGACADCDTTTFAASHRISVVELAEDARVLDLAWHRSERAGLGNAGAVLALPSRDLRRVVFNSTWGRPREDSQDDVFVIELPEGAIPTAR